MGDYPKTFEMKTKQNENFRLSISIFFYTNKTPSKLRGRFYTLIFTYISKGFYMGIQVLRVSLALKLKSTPHDAYLIVYCPLHVTCIFVLNFDLHKLPLESLNPNPHP